jgi:hypothetical protein
MTTNRMTRQAEDFDRALSGEHGRVDPAMAALVAVAGALAAVPQRPAPAFRDALRTRLMAEAANMAASAASVPAASVPAASVPAASAPVANIPAQAARTAVKAFAHPAMQVATGGLAAVIAITGTGVGAHRSLPGDRLYGLKRTVEGLQTDLASGALGEADALLGHAQTRLAEVRALLERAGGTLTGDALAQVEKTLGELGTEIRTATDQLLSQARAGSREAYDRLQAVVADLSRQLVDLMPQLPAGARSAVAASLATLNVARVQLAMLPKPGTVVVPPGPTGSVDPRVVPTPPPSVVVTPPPSVLPTPPVSVDPSKLPTPPVSVDPSKLPTPPVSVDPSILPTEPPVTVNPTVVPTLPITLPPLAP